MLLLAAIGWVRSYFAIDAVHWSDGQHFVSVLSSGGRINVHATDWRGKTAWTSGWTFTTTSRANPASRPMWETDPDIYGRRRFLGFEWSTDLSPWPSNQTVFLSFLPAALHADCSAVLGGCVAGHAALAPAGGRRLPSSSPPEAGIVPGVGLRPPRHARRLSGVWLAAAGAGGRCFSRGPDCADVNMR